MIIDSNDPVIAMPPRNFVDSEDAKRIDINRKQKESGTQQGGSREELLPKVYDNVKTLTEKRIEIRDELKNLGDDF